MVRSDGAVATLDAGEVLRQAGIADADVGPGMDVTRVNSSDMTPDLTVRVAAECRGPLADPDVAGAVVLHGTEPMEETAFVRDLTVPSSKPAVFTGAMRPVDSVDADGPENIRRAIAPARHDDVGQSRRRRVRGWNVVAARWARKADSLDVRPFAAPQLGVLGTSENVVRLPLSRPAAYSRQGLPIPDEPLPAVPLVTAYTGMPQKLLLAVVETQDARGLVLEGFGAGNLPGNPRTHRKAHGRRRRGCRGHASGGGGRRPAGLRGPGGHAGLIDIEAVSSSWLTAAKTRLLLQPARPPWSPTPFALFARAVQSPAPEFGNPS